MSLEKYYYFKIEKNYSKEWVNLILHILAYILISRED